MRNLSSILLGLAYVALGFAVTAAAIYGITTACHALGLYGVIA